MADEETPRVVLEAEAAETRERIASTVEQLEERLNPRNIVRNAFGSARESTARLMGGTSDLLGGASDWAGENRQALTVGGALAGVIAVAGLIRRRRRRRTRDEDGWATSYDGYGSYFEEMDVEEDDMEPNYTSYADYEDGDTRSRLGRGYESAKDRAASLAGDVSDRARSLAVDLGDRASVARQRAGEYSREARDWTADTYQQNPLIGILAGFAAGAVLGALLPETDRENELLGETRDRLATRVRDTAHSAVDAGKAKLGELGVTTDGVKAKIADLADQAKHAATDVAQAVAAEVKPASTTGSVGGNMNS